MVMCIPNPLYNSLDVNRFYNNITNFEMTSGHVVTNIGLGAGCNTYSGANSMHFGVNCANCDTITKLGMWYLKSKMAAIFQDGHEQINFTLHEAGPNCPNSSSVSK